MSEADDTTVNAKPIPDVGRSLAVALADSGADGDIPRVVAGGQGAVARQILDIAFANGVKVREDADMAQLLTRIDVESDIPVEAFAAVAEILTYVYQSNQNMNAHPETAKTAKEMIRKWTGNEN